MSGQAKILLVDDDPLFLESNRDLLEAYGYEVWTAAGGDEGYARAMEVRPDLIVLDVMMGTSTEGLQVAKRISGTPELKGMRVLLVSGITKALHVPAELRPDPSWLPVDRVLEKPVDPQRLVSEIERLLGRRGG